MQQKQKKKNPFDGVRAKGLWVSCFLDFSVCVRPTSFTYQKYLIFYKTIKLFVLCYQISDSQNYFH